MSRMGGPMARGSHASDGKAKDVKRALLQLGGYCRRHITPILIAVILAITSAVLAIIGPDKLGEMADIVRDGMGTGIDISAVTTLALVLVGIYAVSSIFGYFQGFLMATVTQRVSKRLRTDISKKINIMPLKYFDSTSYGDVLSRVTNDVDMIGQTLNQSVITIVFSVGLLIGVLIMMFVVNWIMALTAIGSSIIGFALMFVIMMKSQKHFTRQQVALGEMNGHVEEIYSGHNVVKAYNGERAANEKFNQINKKLYSSSWKSQFMSGLMMPLMGFIGNLGFVAVCIVGAVLVHGNYAGVTLGTIVSFMLYVRLFSQPLSQIAQAATSLQSAAAASERVFEFLGEEEMSDESHKTKKLETVRGDVEFDHVKFGYSGDKIIIHDFSAKAKAGQKIAIVGPTGAGKTTMVNLLMRFYETSGGKIKLDGVPIDEITRANVHALFGMVLQDTWLFEGTIRDNIVYSKENVTNEQVIAACKATGLDHFIKTLPHGYDTVLNDNVNLSAGQKQLITIARAMIEDAPMLILDEATSSVDTRTEVLIQEAMDRLTEGRTSFVIAHRLSTIKNADLILVMRDGDIVESGNHNELIQKGGFYSELYNSQFEKTA